MQELFLLTVKVQILQNEVIVLVNHLAKIIHDQAISWSGNPTMNMEGSFLLSWRLPIAVTDDNGSVVSVDSNGNDDLESETSVKKRHSRVW